MMTSTRSPRLNIDEATPLKSPLCQKPPSPITEMVRFCITGATAPAAASDMPKPRIELPRLNGARVANEWQPMSLEMWTLPTSRSRSLIAEKTGRSGQPTQKPGGRSGNGPPSRRCASARPARAASKRSRGLARSMSLADWAKNFSRPSVITSAVYSPAIGSTSLP